MARFNLALAAAAVFVTLSGLQALARDPSPPRGGEWYRYEQNRVCDTYRKVGSGAIASPFEIGGQLYVFRRGRDCNYGATTTTIRGGEFAGRTATWVNVGQR